MGLTHEELLANISEEIKSAEFEERCNDGGWSAGAKALHSVVELHSEVKAEPASYCKACSVVGVLTIAWPCPTITVIDRMMK